LAKIRERYGSNVIVHKLNPDDLLEGERATVELRLERETPERGRVDLVCTSLGPESYKDDRFLTAAIHDGKAQITRWSATGNCGLSCNIPQNMRAELASLELAYPSEMVELGSDATPLKLGTTSSGWDVVFYFHTWKTRTIAASTATGE
jgi:hypothetical protein